MKLQSDIAVRAVLISKIALFTCLAPGLRRLKKLGAGVARAFSSLCGFSLPSFLTLLSDYLDFLCGGLGLPEPVSQVQFSSVTQSCLTLCDPMHRSTPGLPVHHQLPESTQTHLHWFGYTIQPSHPLSSPSSPAPNPSQHQGLFQWVNSSHEVAKVLEFQLQHQSFQWTPRTDLL